MKENDALLRAYKQYKKDYNDLKRKYDRLTDTSKIVKENADLKKKNDFYINRYEALKEKYDSLVLNCRISSNDIVGGYHLHSDSNHPCPVLKLKEIIEELAPYKDECFKLNKKVEELEKEIKRLKVINKKDFEDSSIPSSMCIGRKKITNNREVSGKLPGGQVGHKHHPRKDLEASESIYIKPSEEITNNPNLYKTGKQIHKKLVDISFNIRVIDYYTDIFRHKLTKTRVHEPFPNGISDEINYGEGIKSFSFLLNDYYNVPLRKVSNFLEELSDGSIKLSDGFIKKLESSFSKLTKDKRKEIFNQLVSYEYMHTDNTAVNVSGSHKTMNIYINPNNTLYQYKDHKGLEGIKESPLELYNETVISDHDVTYYNFGKDHQECLAHILRYLKAAIEIEDNLSWHRKMSSFLKELIHLRKEDNLPPTEDIYKEYDDILNIGYKEYQEIDKSKIVKDNYNLLKRLTDYKESTLLFTKKPNIPHTNNPAEKGLRAFKRKQKIIGAFRSEKGANDFANCLSIIETAKQNKLDKGLYKQVKDIFNNR